MERKKTWIHRGFDEFARGSCEDGGSNLYVNAKGFIETIHRTDIDNDGYVDIVLPNAQGYNERGPTWIYKPGPGPGADWERRQLPNDSGDMCRIVDLDGDGYLDLIIVNSTIGVSCELLCHIYWGGPDGLTGERTDLPTVGAYDVAALDVDGDGRLDVVQVRANRINQNIDIILVANTQSALAATDPTATHSWTADRDDATGDQGVDELTLSPGATFTVSTYIQDAERMTGFGHFATYDTTQLALVQIDAQQESEGNVLQQADGTALFLRTISRQIRCNTAVRRWRLPSPRP